MEKKILFFENSKRDTREIAKVATMKEANAAIYKFCTERGFKIYYSQYQVTPIYAAVVGADIYDLTIDVGSWSEFFHIYFISKEEAEVFIA